MVEADRQPVRRNWLRCLCHSSLHFLTHRELRQGVRPREQKLTGRKAVSVGQLTCLITDGQLFLCSPKRDPLYKLIFRNEVFYNVVTRLPAFNIAFMISLNIPNLPWPFTYA